MKKSASSRDRPGRIEIQKGEINLEDTASLAFCHEPEKTMRDMENMELRRSGMTLTKHEPKR